MVKANTDKPSTSSAPNLSKEEIEALGDVLSAGKRHLICNEPDKALELFVELCEKLSDVYGQEGDECAEAYLYYGKTLLELARLENGVLGHAVKEAPVLGPDDDTENETKTEDEDKDNKDETLTDEKRSEIRENVEHAMRGGNLYNDATTEDETEPEDEQPESAKEKESETAGGSTKEKADEMTEADAGEAVETITDEVVEDVEDGETAEDQNDCGEQDITNMELAWEMLELTGSICTRMLSEEGKDKKKANEMLAEAKYGLAQISMEQEQYEPAVTDFKACLKIQSEIFEDKLDRRLAEVHYNIALAYSFDKKFGESIVSFKEAVSLLESRKQILKEKVKTAEETSGKGKASTELNEWNKEIKELEDLIVLDMNAKIEDAEEMKRQSDLAIKAMKEATKEMFSAASGFESGFGFDSPSDNVEQVHDITNLVRSSKRKSDDDDSSVETKKVKTTVAETTNGVVNGKTTVAETTNGVGNCKANGVAADEKPTSIGA